MWKKVRRFGLVYPLAGNSGLYYFVLFDYLIWKIRMIDKDTIYCSFQRQQMKSLLTILAMLIILLNSTSM